MWIRNIAIAAVLALCLAPWAAADTIVLKDGSKIDGVIQKMEKGKVFVDVAGIVKEVDILKVDSMDFNTPHLTVSAEGPVGHFMESNEAQEVVRNLAELEKTAEEVRRLTEQIRASWTARQPIDSREKAAWESVKHTFSRPVVRYQELLNDLYFHVLNRVDEYHELMEKASKVYVGVRGIQAGSSLVPADMKRLPLRRYVPGGWYDTIFYEGYNRGFDDAYLRYGTHTTY